MIVLNGPELIYNCIYTYHYVCVDGVAFVFFGLLYKCQLRYHKKYIAVYAHIQSYGTRTYT